MSRGTRNWLWLVLACWAILLCALAEARAEDEPKEIVLSSAEKAELLSGFDAYQSGLKKYLDAMKKANRAHGLPEATGWNVTLGTCAPQTGGKIVCDRALSPVLDKPKSNVPSPATPVPSAQEPKK